MRTPLNTVRRLMVIAVVAAIATTTFAPSAGANAGDKYGDNENRDLLVEAFEPGGTTSIAGSSPWGECTYRAMTTEEVVAGLIEDLLDLLTFSGDYDLSTLVALVEGHEHTDFEFDGELVGWNEVTCPGPLLEPGGRAIWPVGDAIPERVIRALARRASDNAKIPIFFAHGAPSGTADDPFVTGVETHLWLDGDVFQPVVAEAEIEGLVRVSITATPQDPVWDPGDGSAPFTCDGPGEPWNDGDRVAECGHEYQRSTSTSASGTFTLAVSTTWTVAYECVNLARSGAPCEAVPAADLSPRTITSTRPVHVAEIQAIVTDA